MHEYTMYFEKLYDILIILELIQSHDYFNFKKSIYIFVDNQVAIQIFHKSKQKTNQYMLKKIVKLHHDIIVKHEITLH